MIRDHLIAWREENINIQNYKQYIDAIQLLPENDRETAAALWHHNNPRTLLTIIMAFHEVDFYRTTSTEQTPCRIIAKPDFIMEEELQKKLKEPRFVFFDNILSLNHEIMGEISDGKFVPSRLLLEQPELQQAAENYMKTKLPK